jgi:hypothetical protein
MFYLFEYADKILCVLRALARAAFALTHELSRRAKKNLFTGQTETKPYIPDYHLIEYSPFKFLRLIDIVRQ